MSAETPLLRLARTDLERPATRAQNHAKERARRLALVSDFMAWKLSPGLILA
jgi:hypothetical protein